VSNPLVLHVVRPYETEEAYLEAEAWSIDAKTMLLIGQRKLPEDTAVLFDVALSTGEKIIKAEARVVGVVPPAGERPGGVRVRFKRFGAMTKAFIDRALEAQRKARESEQRAEAPTPPSSPQAEPAASPTQGTPGKNGSERSGVHERVARRVAPPPNREELLEKLRQRSLALKSARRLPADEEQSA
jgi:hypothetical protein